MGINKTVFASRAERKNYQKLQSQWGNKYNVYQNLPFLNIFSRDNLFNIEVFPPVSTTVSDIDWQRLKKTSVDFVLCDQEYDRPLICIDFDGIQDGFNVGRDYRAGVETPSPWRDQIMTLKLKVAHGSLFPFFVVGSKHFEDFSPSIKLRIVDGIIGEVLAKNATSERFALGFNPSDIGMNDDEWDTLSIWDQRALFEDWALGVEVRNDLEHNPICSEVARLMRAVPVESGAHHFVHPSNVATEKASVFGAQYVLQTSDVGTITRTVWMPNFHTPGFSGYGLTEEIAHLIALDEVHRRRTRPLRNI
jgi:hypothetical protein